MAGTFVTEKSGTLNCIFEVPAGTLISRNEYYTTPVTDTMSIYKATFLQCSKYIIVAEVTISCQISYYYITIFKKKPGGVLQWN